MEPVRMQCPNCGAKTRGPAAAFANPIDCPKCGQTLVFRKAAPDAARPPAPVGKRRSAFLLPAACAVSLLLGLGIGYAAFASTAARATESAAPDADDEDEDGEPYVYMPTTDVLNTGKIYRAKPGKTLCPIMPCNMSQFHVADKIHGNNAGLMLASGAIKDYGNKILVLGAKYDAIENSDPPDYLVAVEGEFDCGVRTTVDGKHYAIGWIKTVYPHNVEYVECTERKTCKALLEAYTKQMQALAIFGW